MEVVIDGWICRLAWMRQRLVRRAAAALVLVVLAGCASARGGVESAIAYPYEVHLPSGYSAGGDAHPLILFLHGGGGLIPEDHLIPAYARTRPDFPFVVIAPRTDDTWSPTRLEALLREVEERYRIDPDRIYLTGLSMGAFGAFRFAAAHPGRFAAMALVAGGGDEERACAVRDLPVRIVHNRADSVVPVSRSERLAAALAACGGAEVRLAVLEDLEPGLWDHNAWKAAYGSSELYRWFLEHRRRDSSAAPR